MIVRPMARADLPAAREVIASTGLFPEEMLDDMAEPFLKGDASEFWLVIAQDAAFGLAYCAPERMTEGTWNLLLIAVEAGRQGQGYGAALVRQVEQRLRAAGERILLVETSGLPEFERTRRFYERLGYVEEARIRGFYKAGEDKVVFRKAMTGA